MTQFKYLGEDLKTWSCRNLSEFFYLFFEAGVWSVVAYRIGRSLFLIRIPVIKILCRLLCFILFKFSEGFLGISLPPGVPVGPGLHIGHTGLIIINHGVKIGKNLTLAHGVTIGTLGIGKTGTPEIGDGVFIGSGAKILGNVKIGDHVHIGANAVVIKDVPSHTTAVGVPARIIQR